VLHPGRDSSLRHCRRGGQAAPLHATQQSAAACGERCFARPAVETASTAAAAAALLRRGNSSSAAGIGPRYRHGRQGGAERPRDRDRSVHAEAVARASRIPVGRLHGYQHAARPRPRLAQAGERSSALVCAAYPCRSAQIMERDSGGTTAAFDRCRSEAGAGRAPADAWPSS
jgi:hypothetical protein